MDADGNPQHPGDLAAQLELSLDNLEAVLAVADMTLANVVRLNSYGRGGDEFVQAIFKG
jgi:enamine deaminase RidA (YjgF/YER057c/UK114 family)